MNDDQPATTRHSTRRWWLWTLAALLILGLLAAVSALAIVHYYEARLPSIQGKLSNVPLDVPLRVYSEDGKLLGEFGIERRAPLKYEQIPKLLVDAFVAAEDARFFEHPGFDWRGLLRAGIELVLTGQKTQGGSTITMQLARNLFLSPQKTYSRKIKEILLALRIENQLSKQQIMQLYLNEIYLGHRAYGIAAAARVYFGENVDQLSLSEMAVLAGLPKAPSTDNPLTSVKRAVERRDYVLGRMRDLGMISVDQYNKARSEQVLTSDAPSREPDVEADYVAEMVRAQMVEKYGDKAYTSGFKVTTTINSAWQEAANNALRRGLLAYDQRHGWRKPTEHYTGKLDDAEALVRFLHHLPRAGGLVAAVVLKARSGELRVRTQVYGKLNLEGKALAWAQDDTRAALASPGDVVYLAYTGRSKQPWQLAQIPQAQSALVALDPHNGAIRALVGGFDFRRSKFNRAEQALRQPGSAFKPFLYSAALDYGYSPASIINDAPIVVVDPATGKVWRPENYEGSFRGPTSLRVGLEHSINLVSVRLLMALGVKNLIDHTVPFGLPRERMAPNLTLALGTATFTPLEMARAYSVFANNGYRITPWLIKSVTDYYGHDISQANPQLACDDCAADTRAPRAISAANAYIMTDMLKDVIRHGTGHAATVLGRNDLAGKTGTTDKSVDAWFCGYNPNLVTTVWVGFDQQQSLGPRETGARAALPIWTEFMGKALGNSPDAVIEQPAGVVAKRVNPATGQPVSGAFPDARYELFLANPPQQLPSSSPDHYREVNPEQAPPASGGSLENQLQNLF